jgi:hypothetical protein
MLPITLATGMRPPLRVTIEEREISAKRRKDRKLPQMKNLACQLIKIRNDFHIQ